MRIHLYLNYGAFSAMSFGQRGFEYRPLGRCSNAPTESRGPMLCLETTEETSSRLCALLVKRPEPKVRSRLQCVPYLASST